MMADVGLPLAALRRQVAQAIDLVVQTARLHDGRRRITHISEVGLDEKTETYRINDVFALDTRQRDPKLRWTGHRPVFADEIGWRGLKDRVKLTSKVFAARRRGKS